MLRGVTTLTLGWLPPRSHQNTEQLLVMLGRMSDLRHSYLDQALPSAASFLSSVAFSPFQSISLPSFSHFDRFTVDGYRTAVLHKYSAENKN